MAKNKLGTSSSKSTEMRNVKSHFTRFTRVVAAFTASLFLVSSNLAYASQSDGLAGPRDRSGNQMRQLRQQLRQEQKINRQESRGLDKLNRSMTKQQVIANPQIGKLDFAKNSAKNGNDRSLRKSAVTPGFETKEAKKENRQDKINAKKAERLGNFVVQENIGGIVKLDNGANLDLTGSDRNITLGEKLFKGSGGVVTIEVGGEKKSVYAGSKVTAAEYVAVKQVLNGDGQKLIVDGSGRAIGGEVLLDTIAATKNTMKADSLVVAEGVTAIGDLDKKSNFKLGGDLINFGSVYAVNTKGNNRGTVEIAANNITNESGALISSNAGSAHGNKASVLDLSLAASNDFTNRGTVESSGDLTIFAGANLNNADGAQITASGNVNLNSAAINNAGLVSSQNSNITLDSPTALNVDNHGGTLQALNGAINVRAPNYNGTFNSAVTGGDLISKELNMHTGQGVTDIDVGQLTGTVNGSGTAAHVSAATDTLTIGQQCLTGDPTYKNSAGDIVIDGDIVVGEALAILASGNVTSTSNLTQIVAQDGSGLGYDITIAAGFVIGGGGGAGTNNGTIGPGGIDATANTTLFNGGAGQGGNIDFTASSGLVISSSGLGAGNDGGNVILAARADGANTNGQVLLTTDSLIETSAGAGAVNGNITVLAGRNAAGVDAIQLGSLNTDSGSGTGGNITVRAAQPTAGGGITFNTDGQIVLGSFGSAAIPSANAGITIGEGGGQEILARGDISIAGGSNTTFISLGGGSISSSNGSINIATVGTGGTVINANRISTEGGSVSIQAAGNVDLTLTNGINATGTGSGGSVLLRADTNNDNSGAVLAAGVDIDTSGNNGGNGGNVTADVNGSFGAFQSVNLGDIVAVGNGAGSGGDVTIQSGGGTVNVGDIDTSVGGDVVLTTNANNADINLLGTLLSADSVTLNTNGTGVINVPDGFEFEVNAFHLNDALLSGGSLRIGTLTAGTTIGVAGAAGALNISTAELSIIAASTLFIGNSDSGNITTGALNVAGAGAGAFNLGFETAGDFTTTGNIILGDKFISVDASGASSQINVNNSITATTGLIELISSSNLNLNGALSTGADVVLITTTVGSINVNANVTAGNDIFMDSANNIQIAATRTASAGNEIDAIAANDIDVAGNLTAQFDVALDAGNNLTTSGAGLVTGNNLFLTAGNNIGTSPASRFSGNSFGLVFASAPNGSVFYRENNSPLIIGDSDAGGTLDFIADGNVFVAASATLTATDIVLRSVNGSFNLNALSQLDADTVSLRSNNSITDANFGAGSQINAAQINLTTDTGNIGVDSGNRLNIDAQNLTANATLGSAFIFDPNDISIGAGSSSALNVFDVLAAGTLTVTGTIDADQVVLTADDVTNTGTVTGVTSIDITATNSIVGAGNLISNQINLTSTNGSIGTDALNRLVLDAVNLTLNAVNGSVFVTDTSDVNLGAGDSAAGTTFDVFAFGNLTVSGDVTAPEVLLEALLGDVTVNGDITASTFVSLRGATVTQGGGSSIDTAVLGLQADNGTITQVENSSGDLTLFLLGGGVSSLNVVTQETGAVILGVSGGDNASIDASQAALFRTAAHSVFTGTLSITADNVLNENDLTADTINIQSTSGNGLIFDGGAGGSLNATGPGGINLTATDFELDLFGNQIFFGPANLTADLIHVNLGANFVGADAVTLFTCNLILEGNIFGNPLILECGQGAGTIANSNGDVNLNSDIIFNGLNLAIIASGSINDTGISMIDLSRSSGSGDGGALTMIAGFDFTPATAGQEDFVATLFTLGGPSLSGGSINLGSVAINTGSGAAGTDGGRVLAVASGGTVNLGSVDTSSTTGGVGGALVVIAENGISISGDVDTTGVLGGGVDLLVSAPQIQGGTAFVGNGNLIGPGFFEGSGAASPGNLSIAGLNAGNGSVTLQGAALAGNSITQSGGPLVALNLFIDADLGSTVIGNGSIDNLFSSSNGLVQLNNNGALAIIDVTGSDQTLDVTATDSILNFAVMNVDSVFLTQTNALGFITSLASITASGSVGIDSAGSVDIGAAITADGSIDLASGGQMNTNDDIISNNSTVNLEAGTILGVAAGTTVAADGQVSLSTASGLLDIGNNAVVSSANGGVAINSGTTVTTGVGSSIDGDGNVFITSNDGSTTLNGTVDSANGGVAIAAFGLNGDVNVFDDITAQGSISVFSDQGSVTTLGGTLTSNAGNLSLIADANVDSSSEVIADGDVNLQASTGFIFSHNSVTSTNGSITMAAATDLDIENGLILAGVEVNLSTGTGSIEIINADLEAVNGQININAGSSILLAGSASALAQGDIEIVANNGFAEIIGDVDSLGGGVLLDATNGDAIVTGNITADLDVVINAGNGEINGNGNITSLNGLVNIFADLLNIDLGGDITAANGVTVNAALGSVLIGNVQSMTSSIAVSAGSSIATDLGSALDAATDITLTAGGSIVTNGSVLAGGDVAYDAGSIISVFDTVTATTGFISLDSGNSIGVAGELNAGTDITISSVGSTGIIANATAGNDLIVNSLDFINLQADLTATAGDVILDAFGNVFIGGPAVFITSGGFTTIAAGNTLSFDDDLTIDAGASAFLLSTNTITGNNNASLFITAADSVTADAGIDVGGEIDIAGPGGVNIAGDITAVDGVTIDAGPVFTTQGNITVSAGDVDITANLLNNTFAITGENVFVQSQAGAALTIDGSAGPGGTLSATDLLGTVELTADVGDITFFGEQTFNNTTNINPSFNQAVVIGNGAVITGNDEVNLNTCTLILQGNGTISGNPLNLVCPGGQGTIANSSGDVDLSGLGGLVVGGLNLAIIASGDVLAGTETSLDLSGVLGNGGNLLVVAGFDFTPATAGQENFVSTLFTLGGPSATGGNIDFTGLSIDTSSASDQAGNVTLIANGVTGQAAGTIVVGDISANSAAGFPGGDVTIIGEGGVTAGTISAVGGVAGGVVTIAVADPEIVGGEIQIANGTQTGPGQFAVGAQTDGDMSFNFIDAGSNGIVNLFGGGDALNTMTGDINADVLNVAFGPGTAVFSSTDLNTLNAFGDGTLDLAGEAGDLAIGSLVGATLSVNITASTGSVTTTGLSLLDQLTINAANVSIGSTVIADGNSSINSLAGSVEIAAGGSFEGAGDKTITATTRIDLFGALSGGDVVLDVTGGDITQDANGVITANSLDVSASAGLGLTVLDQASNNVGLLSSTMGALVIFFDNNVNDFALGGINSTESVVLSTTGAITTTADLNVTGNAFLTASRLNNTFTISGFSGVSINGAFGGGLVIDGSAGPGGELITTIGNVNINAFGGDVTFFGEQTFSGTTNINPAFGSSVIVSDNAVVTGNDTVNLNTCSLILQGNGSISGDPLNFNCPDGAGTIANMTGDVDLTGVGLVFAGQSLAIIASGNIIAGSETLIDLSNGAGAGGSLLAVAGFDFSPSTGDVQVNPPNPTVYEFGGPSTSGGNIDFTGLDIVTSGDGGDGGNVTLIARAGNTNDGTVAVGDITADSSGGFGGDILVIAEGGFNIGVPSNTGTAGNGIVTLAAAEPVIVGGTILVLNGEQGGNGFFTFANPAGAGTIANNNGDVDLTGLSLNFIGQDLAIIASGSVLAGDVTSINLSNPTGDGGNLLVVAGFDFTPNTGGQVDFDQFTTFTFGDISTSGGDIDFTNVNITSNGGTGDGGNVTLVAANGTVGDGIITVGDITATGVNAGGDLLLIAEGGFTTGSIDLTGGVVDGTATLAAAQPLIVNPPITVVNGIQGGTGNFSFDAPTGAGTIANSGGDVNLAGNLVFAGLDLAILAANNINTTGATLIDLSNGAGSSGSLTMIAGFDFTPATVGQVTDNVTTFTITGPNALGGNINLGGVNIMLAGIADGGNLIAVANGGTASAGTISLGNIDATGVTNNGNVLIIGESNIATGTIAAAGGAAGGNVTIVVAEPTASVIPSVTVQNGNLLTGFFAAGTPAAGTIATGSIAAGNDVLIGASNAGGITFANSITAGNTVDIENLAGALTFNSTVTATNGGIILEAAGAITASGSLTAGSDVLATATAAGNIAFDGGATAGTGSIAAQAASGSFTSTALTAGTDVLVDVTGNATLNGAVTATSGIIEVVSSSGDITATGTLNAGGDVSISASGPVSLTGAVTSGDDIDIDSATGGVTTNAMTAGNNVLVDAADTVNFNGAIFATAGNIEVTSTTFNAVEMTAGNSVLVDTTGAVNFNGAVLATAGDIEVFSTTFNAVEMTAGNSVLVDAAGAVNLNDAVEATNGTIEIAGTFVTANALTAGTDVLVDATGSVNFNGAIFATTGNISVAGTNVNAGAMTAGNDVLVDATDPVNLSGPVEATNGFIEVFGNGFTANALTAGTNIFVDGLAGNATLDGPVVAGGDVILDNITGFTNAVGGTVNAGGDIFVDVDGGNLTVNGAMTSTGGGIFLATNDVAGVAQTLAINANLTAFDKIDIINTGMDKKLDTMTFGAGVVIATTAKNPGQGQIDIQMGDLDPGNIVTKYGGKFDIVEIGANVNLFGRKVKGSKPVNTLTAEGANLNITNNKALKNKSMIFGGGVEITADPPVAAGTPVYINGRLVGAESEAAVNLGARASLPAPSSTVSLTGPIETSNLVTTNLNTISGINNVDMATTAQMAVNAGSIGGAVQSTTLAGSVNVSNEDDSYMVSAYGPTAQADASICSDTELGIAAAGIKRTPHSDRVVLKQGNVLFVPFVDTVVETPHGKVMIEAKAVALVSSTDDKLAVYDIEDSHKGAVTVEAHGQKLALAPGSHVTIADEKAGEFAQVNAIEAIPHRNLASRSIKSGVKAHTSEFSIAAAMQSVKPLQAVVGSKHPQARKVADRLMKTAAVIIHLGGNGDYQHYFKPAMTAMAK